MTTFILVNPEREVSSIAVLISFRGKKYKKGIGESVAPKQWSPTKKRVKISAGNQDAYLINDSLALWEEDADKTIAYFKEKQYIPTSEEFFEIISKYRFKDATQTTRLDVLSYFDIFIERYTPIRAHNRIKQYKLVKNVLARYVSEKKKTLFFEDLNMNFYKSFLVWFYGQGYSENYFGSCIKILKSLSNEAREVDKIHNSTDINGKNFTAPQRDADSIYLSTEELLKIHHLAINDELIRKEYPDLASSKIGPRIKAYSKARDLFLIGAFTGLRVSDFARLSSHNISDTIIMRTQKTGTKVVIPIHPVVREIIDAGYDFGTTMPDQKINKYIKEVARLAGITDTVTINRSVAGKDIEETFCKYELVTTHTARRSFATNAYKAGVPTIAIMKITGHTRETTFLKYIKVSEVENAEMLKNHPFFQDSHAVPDAEPNI